jgi:hypothetical protein
VRFVPRTSRNRGSKQVAVAAYFGLPAHAKEKGTGHTKECPFNLLPNVSTIVDQSQEIRMMDPDSEQLVEAVRSGVMQFRLHILMEAISRSSSEDKVRKPIRADFSLV